MRHAKMARALYAAAALARCRLVGGEDKVASWKWWADDMEEWRSMVNLAGTFGKNRTDRELIEHDGKHARFLITLPDN